MSDDLLLIHLSDLHFGPFYRFRQDPGEVVATLNADLATFLSQHGLQGHLQKFVVMTGDIAQAGLPDEYDQALAFLINFSKAAEISRDRFIFVPGNHDVCWPICRIAEQEILLYPRTSAPLSELVEKRKLEHYKGFLTRFYGRTPDRLPGVTDLSGGGRVHTFDDLELTIAALNSCERTSHLVFTGSISELQVRDLEKHWRMIGAGQMRKLVAFHHRPVSEAISGSAADDFRTRWTDRMRQLPVSPGITPDVRQRHIDDLVAQLMQELEGMQGHEHIKWLCQNCQAQLVLHGHIHASNEDIAWRWQQDAGPGTGDTHILSTGSWGLPDSQLPTDEQSTFRLIYWPGQSDQPARTWRFTYKPSSSSRMGQWLPDQHPAQISISKPAPYLPASLWEGRDSNLQRYRENVRKELSSPDKPSVLVHSPLYCELAETWVEPKLALYRSPESQPTCESFSVFTERLRSHPGLVAFIVGDSGIGKTSLLLRLLAEFCTRPEEDMAAVYVPLQERTPDMDLFKFVRQQFKRCCGHDVPSKQLETWISTGRVVVLLDGVENVPEYQGDRLAELIKYCRKVVASTQRWFISEREDVHIHRLADRLEDPKQFALFQILPFDEAQARDYFRKLRCPANVVGFLGDNFKTIANSTLVLRMLAKEYQEGNPTRGLSETYEWHAQTTTKAYISSNSIPTDVDGVVSQLIDLAFSEYPRTAQNCQPAWFPPSLDKHPLLTPAAVRRSRGGSCFVHQSWIGFFVAKGTCSMIDRRQYPLWETCLIDRVTSSFLREMLKEEHALKLVKDLRRLADGGALSEKLAFNLSHILQSYFLHGGIDKLTENPRLWKEFGELSCLAPDASKGAHVVHSYLCRIHAQIEGPKTMTPYLQLLKHNPDWRDETVELFKLYNSGLDGTVAQIARHLRAIDKYYYGILLDLFIIECLCPSLRTEHCNSILHAINECHPPMSDDSVDSALRATRTALQTQIRQGQELGSSTQPG